MLTIREKMLFNLGLVQVISICDSLGDQRTVSKLEYALDRIDLASPDISVVPPESLERYQALQKEMLDTFSFLFHRPGCSCEIPAGTLSTREKAAVRLGVALGGTLCENLGSFLVLLPLMIIENQIDSKFPEIALGDEKNEEFYSLFQSEISKEMMDPVIQMQKDKLN